MQVEKWHAFAVWLVGALIAIAWIGDMPYLGLAIALLGGVVFGVVNWYATRNRLSKESQQDQPEV
jgi:4-hydroxybenzoate polyprenyltransferase